MTIHFEKYKILKWNIVVSIFFISLFLKFSTMSRRRKHKFIKKQSGNNDMKLTTYYQFLLPCCSEFPNTGRSCPRR